MDLFKAPRGGNNYVEGCTRGMCTKTVSVATKQDCTVWRCLEFRDIVWKFGMATELVFV